MKPQRILVTGFPHCGTTILRAKIGDCKDVYDSVGEFAEPQNYSTNIPNKWFVWKCPFLHSEFRNNTFSIKKDTWLEHDIIIPIIRNPWNVFTYVIKSGSNPLNGLPPNSNPEYHIKVEEYIAASTHFLDAQNKELYPNPLE